MNKSERKELEQIMNNSVNPYRFRKIYEKARKNGHPKFEDALQYAGMQATKEAIQNLSNKYKISRICVEMAYQKSTSIYPRDRMKYAEDLIKIKTDEQKKFLRENNINLNI